MSWSNSVAQSRVIGRVEPNVQHITQVTSGAYKLKRRNQTLHVVSGTAWVTIDGEDYILTPGQELHIPSGKYPAVLEVMSKQPLVFSEFDG